MVGYPVISTIPNSFLMPSAIHPARVKPIYKKRKSYSHAHRTTKDVTRIGQFENYLTTFFNSRIRFVPTNQLPFELKHLFLKIFSQPTQMLL